MRQKSGKAIPMVREDENAIVSAILTCHLRCANTALRKRKYVTYEAQTRHKSLFLPYFLIIGYYNYKNRILTKWS